MTNNINALDDVVVKRNEYSCVVAVEVSFDATPFDNMTEDETKRCMARLMALKNLWVAHRRNGFTVSELLKTVEIPGLVNQ